MSVFRQAPTRARRLRAPIRIALVLWLTGAPAAWAGGPEAEFAKGTTIVGLQVGGGVQGNPFDDPPITGLSFMTLAPRLSYLFFEPFGSGWLRSAFETGMEGWFQVFMAPQVYTAEGLKLALRYHFLGVGPLVPYIEYAGGVGATNLDVDETRTSFIFVLEGGVGVSYFVKPGVAVNVGYRFQHLSNGNLGHVNGANGHPNRGINSNGGVVGMSFHFH